MKTLFRVLALFFIFTTTVWGQTEFKEPWKDPTKVMVLDPYWLNDLDFDALAKEPRVKGIIHKATEGLKIRDPLYDCRRDQARKRGYLWGSYHLGHNADPIKQADFYLETARPADDEVIALDLENTTTMSLANALLFIARIKEKTGRYPLLYITGDTKALIDAGRQESEFAKTPLWYVRALPDIEEFFLNRKIWPSYTLWQFASELNCCNGPKNCLCPKSPTIKSCPLRSPIPGTKLDMDVNIFNGTGEELRAKWPFTVR